MVNKTLATLIILIALISLTSPAIMYYCSSMCSTTTSCVGWTPADCNNKCMNTATWGWAALPDKSCDLTSTSNRAIIDLSDDVGGGITVSPVSITPDCTNFTNATIPTQGSYKANQVVNILLAGGTSLPHWGLDLFYGLILIDVDGSNQWQNSVKVFTSLDGAPAQNQSSTMTGSSGSGSFYATTEKFYCGANNKKDDYYHMTLTYTHNVLNADISFTISTDNTNKPNALFVIKQIVLIAKLCNVACLSCYTGGTNTTCTSCDPTVPYRLNNNTCETTCKSGYGYTDDPAMCVWCNPYCTVCYGVADSCTACYSNGTNASYLYVNDTAGYSNCVKTCPVGPPGYFANATTRVCDLCDPTCATCKTNSSYCLSCIAGYGWNNWICYQPCDIGYYYSNNNTNCTKCPLTCSECTNSSLCTACTLNGTNIGYLQNNSCVNPCSNLTYGDTNNGMGPNICLSCDFTCPTCTGNPSPCQSCITGYYLYNQMCGTTCPTGYVALASINKCIDCSVSCIDLSIKIYSTTAIASQIYVDMTFSQPVDFTTFDYQNFQTISIVDNPISGFTISYAVLSNTTYRITIKPINFVFLYNDTVTVTTIALGATLDTGISGTPFMPSNYQKSAQMNWFLLKAPDMSDTQQKVINGLSSINSVFATVTTTPFVAQIKKSGLLSMVFSGAFMTTTSIFINQIPAQNRYEASRFWGIFVQYDVPPWQQNSKIPNYALGAEMHNLTSNQRRLFELTSLYWRFQRTGQTSFFIYDVYVPMLLILICWTCAFIAYLLRNKVSFKLVEGKFFAILHKIHEISIFYVTMGMMMEWIFFDAASFERWVSLLVCITFNIYFVGYQLYIYYDMIKYPDAIIGNQKYEYYLNKYSCFLKNIRFVEYDTKQDWSPKHWFRPYNFHILSYYRKFCVIICLPIFYENKHVQLVFLILIQLIELARFLATQPYSARWRNNYRLILELFLLTFFVIILAEGYVMEIIQQNNSDTLLPAVTTLYRLGWVGFALIFGFNIGYLILFFIDIVQGFRYSNRELMDEARRLYYYDKISAYEKQNDQVPLGLMNRWVKMGNLNLRNMQDLPDINLRVECYRLVRKNDYFDVEILKIVELFMNTDLNFHKENNTIVGKKINKKTKLSKEVSSSLYNIMCGIFNKYAKKDTQAITIKTFIRISQRQFQAGDKVPLIPEGMFQKLELQTVRADKSAIKLGQMIQGFPLKAHDLQSI